MKLVDRLLANLVKCPRHGRRLIILLERVTFVAVEDPLPALGQAVVADEEDEFFAPDAVEGRAAVIALRPANDTLGGLLIIAGGYSLKLLIAAQAVHA